MRDNQNIDNKLQMLSDALFAIHWYGIEPDVAASLVMEPGAYILPSGDSGISCDLIHGGDTDLAKHLKLSFLELKPDNGELDTVVAVFYSPNMDWFYSGDDIIISGEAFEPVEELFSSYPYVSFVIGFVGYSELNADSLGDIDFSDLYAFISLIKRLEPLRDYHIYLLNQAFAEYLEDESEDGLVIDWRAFEDGVCLTCDTDDSVYDILPDDFSEGSLSDDFSDSMGIHEDIELSAKREWRVIP